MSIALAALQAGRGAVGLGAIFVLLMVFVVILAILLAVIAVLLIVLIARMGRDKPTPLGWSCSEAPQRS